MQRLQTITMKDFTEFMHNLSGALMLIGQTLISAFFVIVILCLVLAVEIQRVAHGILLFEQSHNLAYLGAFVLVMMLLTLEFVIHYVEAKNDYHQQRQTEFSLRLLGRWFAYFVGYENKKDGVVWNERLKSPAQAIKTYSRLLTMTILILALGGSMSDAISTVQGNWIEGLETIATESTLLQFWAYSEGLLVALALVVGTQRLTSYVAQRAAETLEKSSHESMAETHSEIEPDYVVTIDLPDDDQQALPFPEIKMIDFSDSNEQDTEPVEPVLHNFVPEWLLEAHDLGYHIVTCDDCGWQSEPKDKIENANRALAMHQRHCEVYQQSLEAFDYD